ncbi:right-handed parallel beta-helix repeat-containing protein [Anoxybacterium hadale]|uniref:Right-handed parallel beta-helix repeat-containing protein n=1 Tax=Anoxybacterium hadale TaxID=3408580 RepID=A0ACD1A6N4_9FIRM|nr:right-handed parallel beta-helix repeat-containing protein [Clostridiales bacterium]
MAIINVSPSDNLTELIASDAVSAGDVLLLADGLYLQTVFIDKNFIRIISRSGKAVFSGFSLLLNGFILSGVIGVEIYGVTVRNYVQNGIAITGGSANRIVSNTIHDMGNNGIRITGSAANLIWKNNIRDVGFDGILMISGSTSNWVICNEVNRCGNDGIETFLSNDANNAIVENRVCDCDDNCFEAFGVNTLLLRNKAAKAGSSAYYIASGSNTICIENEGVSSDRGALVTITNVFAACNNFSNNSDTGLLALDDFGIYQGNFISRNRDSGLVFAEGADYNFIYSNKIVCNEPADILDNGTGNNYLKNITG